MRPFRIAGVYEPTLTGRRIAPACHALYMSLYFRRLDGVGLKKRPPGLPDFGPRRRLPLPKRLPGRR
jgi:hypothetical protein